jgi:hypothetical protein
LGGSAAGQPPFTTGTRLVCQAVVLKDGLFAGRWQLGLKSAATSQFVGGTAHSAPQQQYDNYDDNDNDNGANTDINWLFLSLWCTSRELP